MCIIIISILQMKKLKLWVASTFLKSSQMPMNSRRINLDLSKV